MSTRTIRAAAAALVCVDIALLLAFPSIVTALLLWFPIAAAAVLAMEGGAE